MSDRRPEFPTAPIIAWLTVFSAAIALITVWALPLGLVGQLLATAVFAIVPTLFLVFWLGRVSERRMQQRARRTH